MKKELDFFSRNSVYFQFSLLFLSVFSFSFASGGFGDGDSQTLTTASPSIVLKDTATQSATTATTIVTKSFTTEYNTNEMVNGLQEIVTKKVTIPEGAVVDNGAVTIGEKTYTLTEKQLSDFTGKPTSKNFLSSKLGLEAGGGWDAVVSGAQWAAIAYFAGTMLGDAIGMTESQSKSLGYSLGAGVGL